MTPSPSTVARDDEPDPTPYHLRPDDTKTRVVANLLLDAAQDEAAVAVTVTRWPTNGWVIVLTTTLATRHILTHISSERHAHAVAYALAGALDCDLVIQ